MTQARPPVTLAAQMNQRMRGAIPCDHGHLGSLSWARRAPGYAQGSTTAGSP
jgi:hypothetical protein